MYNIACLVDPSLYCEPIVCLLTTYTSFATYLSTQSQIPNFLGEIDLPQAHSLDSAETIWLKAESYFKDSLTSDICTMQHSHGVVPLLQVDMYH